MNSASTKLKKVSELIRSNPFLANFDLTTALDYYGSDRAREDFLAGRDEPEELLKNGKGANHGHGKNTSVVDHLFESQRGNAGFREPQTSGRVSKRDQGRPTGQNKIGHVSHIVREIPANFEPPKHLMVDNQRHKLLSKLGIRK